MSAPGELGRRAVACKGWRWMPYGGPGFREWKWVHPADSGCVVWTERTDRRGYAAALVAALEAAP